jgi:cytochrome c553
MAAYPSNLVAVCVTCHRAETAENTPNSGD